MTLQLVARIQEAAGLPLILRRAAVHNLHACMLRQPDATSVVVAWGDLYRLIADCARDTADEARRDELIALAADSADRGRRMLRRIQQNRPRARQFVAPRVIDAQCVEVA